MCFIFGHFYHLSQKERGTNPNCETNFDNGMGGPENSEYGNEGGSMIDERKRKRMEA